MKLDAITLEILNQKLTALTEEMCHILQRTGRTLYVKETADFCCAVADPQGKFFAYPRGIGVSGFVGLNALTTLQAITEPEPGDVILTNDPWRSRGLATHLPDLQVLEPWLLRVKSSPGAGLFYTPQTSAAEYPAVYRPLTAIFFRDRKSVV